MVSCKFVRKLVNVGAVSSKLKSVPKDFRSLAGELFSNSNPPRSDNWSEKENNKDELKIILYQNEQKYEADFLAQPSFVTLGRALDLGLKYCKRHKCHSAPYYLNSDKPFLTLSDQYPSPVRDSNLGLRASVYLNLTHALNYLATTAGILCLFYYLYNFISWLDSSTLMSRRLKLDLTYHVHSRRGWIVKEKAEIFVLCPPFCRGDVEAGRLQDDRIVDVTNQGVRQISQLVAAPSGKKIKLVLQVDLS